MRPKPVSPAIPDPITMADDLTTECMFTAGSSVSCVTCFEEQIEGEVIAFDYKKKLLILKGQSSNSSSSHNNDVHWINLDFVKDVSIKKEVKKEDVIVAALPQINMQKVESRAREAVAERKRLAEAIKSGVTEDGIKIYLSLSKTIDGKVSWEGETIVVMNNVKINPPYKVDNCVNIKLPGQPPEAVKYAKKLVEKYWNDQSKLQKEIPQSPPPLTSATPTTPSASAVTATKTANTTAITQKNTSSSNTNNSNLEEKKTSSFANNKG